MATKSTVKVSPLADRVVVKPLEETEQMRGGLYIPDTAKEKPQQGKVIAAGPGRFENDTRVPMEVRSRQDLYGKYRVTGSPSWRHVSHLRSPTLAIVWTRGTEISEAIPKSEF